MQEPHAHNPSVLLHTLLLRGHMFTVALVDINKKAIAKENLD